jgi:hypothetical protein
MVKMQGKKEPFYTVGWERKLVQPLLKSEWRHLKKLKIELTYNPASPPLST